MFVPCQPKCMAKKKDKKWKEDALAKASPVLSQRPLHCPLGPPRDRPCPHPHAWRPWVTAAVRAVTLVKAVEAACAAHRRPGEPVHAPSFRLFRAGQDNPFFEETLAASPGLAPIRHVAAAAPLARVLIRPPPCRSSPSP